MMQNKNIENKNKKYFYNYTHFNKCEIVSIKSSDDIAKLTPTFVSLCFVKIQLIIPINSPFSLTTAPPEDPGLAAASI